MELKGKSAVVTGGGNGIGRAICIGLAQRGANVMVADLEEAAARSVADELEALGVQSSFMAVDVADEKAVQCLAAFAWETFESIDVLVNNAGVVQPTKPLWETSADDFSWCFSVNVGGAMNGIRAFVPRFIASGKPAWILNTGSEHSLGVPHLFGGLYTGSKHALLGVSDVLRRELPEHIGVTVLCPGLADSSLWRASERRHADFGGAERADQRAGEMMKLGMPAEQVAQVALAAVENECFYAISHGHVVDYAQARWEEVREACASQAPKEDGYDQYKLEVVMQKLMNSNEGSGT